MSVQRHPAAPLQGHMAAIAELTQNRAEGTQRADRQCSSEEVDEDPCVSGAAAPSDGIMAIYQQFRHLWARSAQPANSSSRRSSRSYISPSAPQPQPQPAQPPVPPAQAPAPANLQQLGALQQPLPILLPLFGMSAAAA